MTSLINIAAILAFALLVFAIVSVALRFLIPQNRTNRRNLNRRRPVDADS